MLAFPMKCSRSALDSLPMDRPFFVRKRAAISVPIRSVHVHGTNLLCVDIQVLENFVIAELQILVFVSTAFLHQEV